MPVASILGQLSRAFLASGGLRGGAGVSLPDGVDVELEFEGWESFVAKLDAVARSQVPAATANALNKSGTQVVKRTKKHVGKAEGKTARQLGSTKKGWGIRVAKRAHAPLLLRTQVVAPKTRGGVKRLPGPVSKSFNIPGHGKRSRFVRAKSAAAAGSTRSKRWTTGRPHTSSENLPIYKVMSHSAERRRLTLERAGRVVMREYFPRELVKQLNNRIAKLRARR